MTCFHGHAGIVYNCSGIKSLQIQAVQIGKSELFDAEWHLEKYKDIAKENMNPAENFFKFSAIEERNPNFNFNTKFYVLNNSDIAASVFKELSHYLHSGIKKQRKTQESPT